MAGLSFSEALAGFKGTENNAVAALLLHDRALQAVIASWPNVSRQLPGNDVLLTDPSLDELWALVKYDEREVVELAGVSTGLAMAAFRRAKGNRLIYPDGTVHEMARGVLLRLLKDILQGKGKR